MGIHQPIDGLAERDRLRSEGQVLRGQFVDGFARLEASVLDYVQRLGLKLPINAPFSQRAKALAAARASFRHPAKLDDRLAEVAEMAALRADIVHSVLSVAMCWDGKDEVRLFLFRNAGNPARPVLMLAPEALKKAATRVATLAHQFSQQQLKAPAPTDRASTSG